MLYLLVFKWSISTPTFSSHPEGIFLILRTAVLQQRTLYIVIDRLAQGDGDILENLFCYFFDCFFPRFRQISEKKSFGHWFYIILPSDKELPAAAASSDCCHFDVIVCGMYLQISAFKKEKWTRKRTFTSE